MLQSETFVNSLGSVPEFFFLFFIFCIFFMWQALGRDFCSQSLARSFDFFWFFLIFFNFFLLQFACGKNLLADFLLVEEFYAGALLSGWDVTSLANREEKKINALALLSEWDVTGQREWAFFFFVGCDCFRYVCRSMRTPVPATYERAGLVGT